MMMTMMISCTMLSKVGPTTTEIATSTAVVAATTPEPVSIVHSGKVIVRQINAPIHPILVYHKFHIDNRQNSVHSLLNIGNWINAATNNTIRYNGMEQQQNTKPVPVV